MGGGVKEAMNKRGMGRGRTGKGWGKEATV